MKEISVKAELIDHYTVKNETRDIQWLSDEPIEMGGANLGPKPTEMMLSSLASCKLITLQMYAERKEWDFQGAEISMRIVGKDEETGRTIVEKKFTFKGDLDEKQINRLIDISGRCPVAKMLATSLKYVVV